MDPRIVREVAESPFPNTFSFGVLIAAEVIKAHTPSLTDEDDDEIVDRIWKDRPGKPSNLAIRTCACGAKIDGYYEYVDHLVNLLVGP